MKLLSSAALAASLAFAAPAFAAAPPSAETVAATQPPPAAAPQTPAPAAAAAPSAAAPAPSAGAAGVNASATVGMSVKDSAGVAIGQITAINPDASGKNMAVVKMGTKSFAIDTTSLAIQGGAATINATKAQIEQMLPK